MIDYGIPDERQREELARVLGHAFAFDIDAEQNWFREAGFPNLRVVRDRSGVVSGLALIAMGQFFGGRSVPIAGVAAVGVRADALRRGAASAMMRRALVELHERRVALASLYASTWALYRKVGFESAGVRCIARIAPHEIRGEDRTLPLRAATPEDRGAVESLYRAHAAAGNLDRGPYIWRRICETRFGVPAHGAVVHDDAGLAGYVFYRKHKLPEGFRHRIEVTDIAARSVAALRRLWAFLGDLGTMAERIELPTAPHDPAFLVHPDPRFRMELLENWMIRIADVNAALTTRGYPPGLVAQLDLDLFDPDLPGNAGRWRLSVAGGQGTAERGGTGALRLDARGLASLWSGFVPAATLCHLGRLEGPADALATATAIFAGETPWMREMF